MTLEVEAKALEDAAGKLDAVAAAVKDITAGADLLTAVNGGIPGGAAAGTATGASTTLTEDVKGTTTANTTHAQAMRETAADFRKTDGGVTGRFRLLDPQSLGMP